MLCRATVLKMRQSASYSDFCTLKSLHAMAKKKAATKKTASAKKTTKAAAAKKNKAADTDADGEEAAPKKKKKAKRKSRAKAAVVIRKKLFWGVFNHAMKRVALYEFNQRKAAEKRAKELSPEGKPPHFVQKVKEEVTEDIAPAEGEEAAPKKKAAKKKAAKK